MKIKYSFSNIFLLTALVGLIVGWWLDHRRLSQGYEHNRNTLVSLIASDTSQDTQNISILTSAHGHDEIAARTAVVRDREFSYIRLPMCPCGGGNGDCGR